MRQTGAFVRAIAFTAAAVWSVSAIADGLNSFEIHAAEGRRADDENVPFNPATGKGTFCISSAICHEARDNAEFRDVPFNPATGEGYGCISLAICGQ